MSSKTSDTSPKADDPEEIQVVPTKNKMETVVEFHAPEVKTNESNSKIKAVVDFHAGEENANESNVTSRYQYSSDDDAENNDGENGLSPEEIQAYEQENEAMYEDLNSLRDNIQQIENNEFWLSFFGAYL